jgi:hypothetical protein
MRAAVYERQQGLTCDDADLLFIELDAERAKVARVAGYHLALRETVLEAEEMLREERAKTRWVSEHAEAVVLGLRSSWENGTVCCDLPERVTALEQVLESYAGLDATDA